MADHVDLVAEMAFVERLQLSDRLRHAKKRRAQQLKAYAQREKRLLKEHGGAGAGAIKKPGKRGSADVVVGTTKNGTRGRTGKRLVFADSVLMLEAVARNDLAEVGRLLAAGINPNVSGSDGLTPLHQCCISNAESMLRVLVDAGANVNVRDSENWTPLHAAAACGRVNLCRLLCDSGADLLAINSDGNMPYDLCEDVGALDFIETEMTKRGVTQELIDETRLSAENSMLVDLKATLSDGGSFEWKGHGGETLLHVAACCGYTRVMQLLVDYGIPLDVTDNEGWQPVHCAAYWSQVPAVELLLQYGISSLAKTQDGLTVLDLCEDMEARQRILEIIDELADKKPRKRLEATEGHGASLAHRSSSARRASNAGGQSLYSWQRRSSIRDKKDAFAFREAQEEAHRYVEAVLVAHDEDDEQTGECTMSIADSEKLRLLRSSTSSAGDDSLTNGPTGGSLDCGTPPVTTSRPDVIPTTTDSYVWSGDSKQPAAAVANSEPNDGINCQQAIDDSHRAGDGDKPQNSSGRGGAATAAENCELITSQSPGGMKKSGSIGSDVAMTTEDKLHISFTKRLRFTHSGGQGADRKEAARSHGGGSRLKVKNCCVII